MDQRPHATLTAAEKDRIDAVIRAVGNRFNKRLRDQGEEPDEADVFHCAQAAVVAFAQNRTETDIGLASYAKAKPAMPPPKRARQL